MTMPQLDWRFDPLPPSGAKTGGLTSAHVLPASLDTFVREVLQNAQDQKRQDSQTTTVRFTLAQYSGSMKDEILETITFPTLHQHLLGAAERGGVTIGPQLREGIEHARSDKLSILRVEDFGTHGLTGDEDDDDERFTALCRNTLVTSEHRQHSGGSFGIGKSVLWRFSRLSTVLFGSQVADDQAVRYRLFGRTELPFHKAYGKDWNGPGWFGLSDSRANVDRSVSVWDSQARDAGELLGISRTDSGDLGTSIAILGFFEPDQEEERSVETLKQEILNSASRWFWPSLFLPTKRPLEVVAAIEENGVTTSENSAELIPEVQPFVDAGNSQTSAEKLTSPGDVLSCNIPISVPGKKQMGRSPGTSNQSANFRLSLRYAAEAENDWSNRVALVRGAGMVVQYHSPKRPLGDQNYHGILWGGLANGDSLEDQSLEEFLRATEPPSHNEWTHKTDRVRESYKPGARARLIELWSNIDTKVIEAFEFKTPDSEQGPRKLAKMFPLKGSSGGRTGKETFRFTQGDAVLETDAWSFSGKVTKTSSNERAWEFTVTPVLDSESGNREPLTAIQLDADGADSVPLEHGWKCIVPGNVRQVTFEGLADASELGFASTDLRRTALVLDVRPRISERN